MFLFVLFLVFAALYAGCINSSPLLKPVTTPFSLFLFFYFVFLTFCLFSVLSLSLSHVMCVLKQFFLLVSVHRVESIPIGYLIILPPPPHPLHTHRPQPAGLLTDDPLQGISCLESQGFHLIPPFIYMLSCSSTQSCYSFCLFIYLLMG